MNVKMRLVAEKAGSDLSSLPNYEAHYGEGDPGELRLYMSGKLDGETIKQLESEICSQGAVLTEPIRQDAGIVVIRFKKALAPLAIIAIAVGGIFVIGGVLIGWQIFRTVKAGVPLWVWIIGGAAVLYLITTSKPVKATGRAAGRAAGWAGKTYIERKIPGGGRPAAPPKLEFKMPTVPPNHQLAMSKPEDT